MLSDPKWRRLSWGDIITLEYGRALRNHRDSKGTVPVYGTNGQIGWCEGPLCKHDGVVIGRKGAYRGVHYSPVPFFAIDTAFYVEPREPIDLRWVYYAFRTLDINAMDSGSAIPSTSRTELYALPVDVPPPHEQRAIATVLGALDDKIQLNQRLNETLDDLARSLVRGEAAQSVPQPCKALASVNSRTIHGELPLETVDYVDIGSVWKGRRESIHEVAREKAPSRARRLVADGDILVSTVRPDRGAYCLLLRPPKNCVASTGFAVVSPNERWMAPLLYCALTDSDALAHYGRVADGGAYPAINSDVIGDLIIEWPSRARELAEQLEPLFQMRATNDQQCETLAHLRDKLLPSLVSGALRIREADKLVGAAR
jgi:type I restriction enzyme S subunit